MKPISFLLAAATLAPALAIAAEAVVEFRHTDPTAFRDIKYSAFQNEKETQGILDELRRHLERKAPRYLPADSKLRVNITDVDMAGEIWPLRHAMREARIVRDVYPPRVDLEFRLTGADGKVMREGRRELRDLAFLLRASPTSDDGLQHEKRLLTQWLQSEFPAAR